MRQRLPIGVAAALTAAAFSSTANSQVTTNSSKPKVSNASNAMNSGVAPGQSETLIVTKANPATIAPGAHRYDRLEIQDGGILTVTGPTTMLVGKLVTGRSARIVYSTASDPGQRLLTINAIDASGITELTVVGSGVDAVDYAPGERAGDGNRGTDAVNRLVTGEWYEVPYFKSDPASPGTGGQPGAAGRTGQDASDVTLYLPGLKSGAKLTVETIGGRGGRGQDGGNGGAGGNASKLHTPASGGAGGAAGPGGRGGSAGRIYVFLVVAPSAVSNKDAIIKAISFRPTYAAATGGAPGTPGLGGSQGSDGGQLCIGSGCGASNGANGPVAEPGPPGAGPVKGTVDPSWAVIDVMDLTTYQQYVAQIWAKLQ